jgi:pimeloyl-ACP methyl ester carboxylesterase
MPNNKNTNYKLGAHIEVQQIKNASHNIMLTNPDKLLKEVLVLIKSLATT